MDLIIFGEAYIVYRLFYDEMSRRIFLKLKTAHELSLGKCQPFFHGFASEVLTGRSEIRALLQAV